MMHSEGWGTKCIVYCGEWVGYMMHREGVGTGWGYIMHGEGGGTGRGLSGGTPCMVRGRDWVGTGWRYIMHGQGTCCLVVRSIIHVFLLNVLYIVAFQKMIRNHDTIII